MFIIWLEGFYEECIEAQEIKKIVFLLVCLLKLVVFHCFLQFLVSILRVGFSVLEETNMHTQILPVKSPCFSFFVSQVA